MLTRRQMMAATLATTLLPARSFAGAKPVTVALDWTPNTNHIGLHVAKAKRFYADAGVEVDILPYSDTSAGALVASRVADFGIVSSLGLFTQRSAGADLIAAYAIMQTETGRLVFNADRKDISSPRDLDGLTYGGFGSAWENALIGSIIRHDGGKGDYETVTLGTSAYEALANGAVDFTLEVYTWEGVKAELEGKKQRAFRYADFGVPDQHSNFIASSEAYLRENPQAASSFVAATRRGYEFAVDHPDEAAEILIAANKDVLTDPRLIRASLQALIDGNYFRSGEGIVGRIDPAKIDAIGTYLFAAGVLQDGDGKKVEERPDFARYFTNDFQTA